MDSRVYFAQFRLGFWFDVVLWLQCCRAAPLYAALANSSPAPRVSSPRHGEGARARAGAPAAPTHRDTCPESPVLLILARLLAVRFAL
jgi:hypothetical protein